MWQPEKLAEAVQDAIIAKLASYGAHKCAQIAASVNVGEVVGAGFGWQPIETAPRDGANVLLFFPWNQLGENIVTEGFWLEDFWWTLIWKVSPAKDHAPSHWMPMPEPPK